MPTSSQILAVRDDQDLRQRIEALVALDPEITENASMWVQNHIYQLAAARIAGPDDSVASVLDYAIATYRPTPRPGENPAAVTDDHIRTAVTAVKSAETAE